MNGGAAMLGPWGQVVGLHFPACTSDLKLIKQNEKSDCWSWLTVNIGSGFPIGGEWPLWAESEKIPPPLPSPPPPPTPPTVSYFSSSSSSSSSSYSTSSYFSSSWSSSSSSSYFSSSSSSDSLLSSLLIGPERLRSAGNYIFFFNFHFGCVYH